MPNLTLYGSMTLHDLHWFQNGAPVCYHIDKDICAFICAPVPLSEYRRMCQNARTN